MPKPLHCVILPWFVCGNNYSHRCAHGSWDEDRWLCKCDAGWRVAGPTDTFAFLRGACTQSMCVDDQQCQRDLSSSVISPEDYPSCIHEGWNCYCGWKYAWEESFTGAENERAKCMGVLYVLSISGGRAIVWTVNKTWRIFAFMALLGLPFGQTHVRCQHTNPDNMRFFESLLKSHLYPLERYSGARARCGYCDGGCGKHPISDWFYAFAWTIYILDFAMVFYLFLAITYTIFLICWAVVMWLVVIIVLIVAAIVAMIGAMCSCAGEQQGCECGDGNGSCQCCEGGHGNHGCCENCNCFSEGSYVGEPNPIIFYDSSYFYSSSPPDGICCTAQGYPTISCFCTICRPLAWIISVFPYPPANLWGGLLGYLMGTSASGNYTGGNRFIDMLSLRSSTDSHDDHRWRDAIAVYIYSYSDETYTVPPPTSSPSTNSQTPFLPTRPSHYGKIFIQSPSPFCRVRDNISEACFEDYCKNECWICRECNPHRSDIPTDKQWHLWISCGHLYCHQCSMEMSRRKMPCPLCRRCSNRIKEGPPLQTR